MRHFRAVLVLSGALCGCGGGGPTTPTATPTPNPTPAPLVSTACAAALRACGAATGLPCVSLRYTTASACRDAACLQGIAAFLTNNGVTLTGSPVWLPEYEMPASSYLYPGCVGMRSDLGGTAQEADCLAQLLNAGFPGANYAPDSTNCRADGFPHMVLAR